MVTVAPRHAYCQDAAIYTIIHQSYPFFDWVVVDCSKDEKNLKYLIKRYGKKHILKQEWIEPVIKKLVEAKEQIRKLAVEKGFDYIFYCDADWILPKNILERLLSHEKDLVGVLYNYGKGRYSWPSVAKSGKMLTDGPARDTLDKLDLFTWEDVFELAPRLIQCYGAGIGLISRNVFEKIPWRFCPDYGIGEDVEFWHETNEKGFQWWIDLSFKIPHLNVSWKKEKFFNEIK